MRYMLDTHTLSYLARAQPALAQRVRAVPMATLCMSRISKAELLFGLAKRPDAQRLHTVVRELLLRIDVLAWDHTVAERYGPVRAALARQGRTVAPLDLLSAAHALSAGAVLVSSDQAFNPVAGLTVEDWTR